MRPNTNMVVLNKVCLPHPTGESNPDGLDRNGVIIHAISSHLWDHSLEVNITDIINPIDEWLLQDLLVVDVPLIRKHRL